MKTAGMSAMGQDCCHDMASPSEHGKPCKPGQECKTASLLQVSVVKPPVALSSPLLSAFSSDFLPARIPSGVWRPPRL